VHHIVVNDVRVLQLKVDELQLQPHEGVLWTVQAVTPSLSWHLRRLATCWLTDSDGLNGS
jgi:hypothetical protein